MKFIQVLPTSLYTSTVELIKLLTYFVEVPLEQNQYDTNPIHSCFKLYFTYIYIFQIELGTV